MIKLIIFDLWQTLAYRAVDYSTTSKMLEETGVSIQKKEFVKIFERAIQTKDWNNKYEAYKQLCERMGLETTKENVKKLMSIRDYAEARTKLYPEAIPLIKQLKEKNLKIGLISNTSVFTQQIIEETGLLDYIDYPVLSYEVGLIKPDPRIYNYLLRLAKVRPGQALMIGDKLVDDVLTPRKLGMKAIHFQNYPRLIRELKKQGLY